MLPPGHIAAGYLATKLFLNASNPEMNTVQTDQLLLWSMFFAFAPDLDMFYAFLKEKSFRHTGKTFSHRQFITHIPLVWFILGISISFLSQNEFVRYFGLIIWFSSWSHFILDSENMGVRWLYPFSKKFFALKNPGVSDVNNANGFFNHWFNLIKIYHQKYKLTFYTEAILICTTLVVFLI
mgnify:CR=1 FL=1